MRTWLKHIFQRKLENLARKAIIRYHPIVIGIAGSVGKTSTKEAMFCVLSRHFTVRKSTKSYNNEFGVPLAVLGLESGYRSIGKWISVFRAAHKLVYGPKQNYPKCIALEMGTDHVGDIKKLMTIVKPDMGVLTAIAPVHLEYFGSYDNVKKEEASIINLLPLDAKAVLNGDDTDCVDAVAQSRVKRTTFGLREGVDVRATDLKFKLDAASAGLSFVLHAGGVSQQVTLGNCLGRPHVYSALAAAAVGYSFGMPLSDIALGLNDFQPAPGRMRRLDGIKHTQIIDDTYNSSPKPVKAALDILKDFPNAKIRFAVLGDMAELGSHTAPLHRDVGAYVPGHADVLITVGEKALEFARGAREAGMDDDKVFSFGETKEAGLFLQDRIHEGDVILIKGSQISRLERVVKEIMAEPNRAGELLVRQEKVWKPI